MVTKIRDGGGPLGEWRKIDHMRRESRQSKMRTLRSIKVEAKL